MPAARIASWLANRSVHYGWIVTGTAFLTMLVSAGVVGAPGVLIVPLQREFGWSAAEVSTSFAIRLVLFGLTGPFAAALMNRYGVRPVVAAALLLIAAALLASLRMTTIWELDLTWGVMVGTGTGFTAAVLGATVATRWFTHRRGLVLGLLTASSATGQLLFLPLLADITARFGWRAAVVPIAVVLVVAACVLFLLMVERPSDLGLAPYGEAVVTPPADAAGSPFAALREASRVPLFWLLFGTFFVCGCSTNGLIQTHFIAFCGDFAIAPVTAAGVLATMGIFDFFGTVGSGWLSDRYDNRRLLFWYYGLRGLSLLFLPFSGFTIPALSVFAMFYGLDWIATVPPTVKLAARRFGRERAALVFGWIFTGHQLGAATAALGAGLVRTAYGTYTPAFLAAGGLCLVAALAVVTLARRDGETMSANLPEALPEPAI